MKALLLASFAAAALTAGDATASEPALERVTVTEIARDGGATALKLNVASGGCTRAADFRLVVTQEPARQTLRVVRLRADTCEMYAARGATVSLTTSDVVADKPLVVENPLFVIRAR